MCKIVLSINPEHVANILAGKKRYEFRKTKCKKKIDSILIYATAPVMRVVAEAEVVGVLEDRPDRVWEETESAAGIERSFFDQYFSNRERAVAYQIGQVKQFKRGYQLSELGISSAPQSFMYYTSAILPVL